MLGQQIVGALLDLGVNVRMIVRGGEDHSGIGRLSTDIARGASVVDADLSDLSSLERAADGVDIIVSAVQGGPDIIIDGQLALAKAGLATGVSRIFPSDFAVDFRHLNDDEHLFFSWRRRAHAAIRAIALPQTNIFNGGFTEMLFQPFFGLIDWENRRVNHWGDADQLYDFTTTADTARFLAAAVVNDTQSDGGLEIAGDTVSPRNLQDIAARVTGNAFELRALGGIVELDAEIAQRQASAPSDPMAWAALQYHRAMASGRGKLHLIANAQYPTLTPTSVLGFCESKRSDTNILPQVAT